jgi:hypothetical protein
MREREDAASLADWADWRLEDYTAGLAELASYCERIERGDVAGWWERAADGPSPAELLAQSEADAAAVERIKASARASYQRRKAEGRIKPKPKPRIWQSLRPGAGDARGFGIEVRSDLFHPCGCMEFGCPNNAVDFAGAVCTNRNDGWLAYCLEPATQWFLDTPRCAAHGINLGVLAETA